MAGIRSAIAEGLEDIRKRRVCGPFDSVDEMLASLKDSPRKRATRRQAARFFEHRRARADFKAFDKRMKRRCGTPPRQGDEMRA